MLDSLPLIQKPPRVLPTWTVIYLNNEAFASLKAEPGTGAALGHTWPARTIPIRPHSSFKDSPSWKTLVAGWGDGTYAAHAPQQQTHAERTRSEARHPAGAMAEASAGRELRHHWQQCMCLAKLA